MKLFLRLFVALVVSVSFSQTTTAQVPVINSFSPISGTVGTNVTVTGNNFSPAVANNTVYFGAVKATILSVTSNSVVVKVPPGATYGPISVTANSLTGYSKKAFSVSFTGGDINFETLAANGAVSAANNNIDRGAAVVDLDGDGLTDIAVTNGDTTFFTILRKNATGFDQGIKYDVGVYSTYILACDMDGDGKKDLLLRQHIGGFCVLRNISTPGKIAFQPKVLVTLPMFVDYKPTIGDFNGDGKPDVAASVTPDYDSIAVFTNTSTIGSISFSPNVKYIPASVQSSTIQAGDLDGDGKDDIIAPNWASHGFLIFRNISSNGNVEFAPAYLRLLTSNNPVHISLADFDDDGKPDVAVSSQNTYSVLVIKNESSPGVFSFQTTGILSLPHMPYATTIGDINGDGKADIVVGFLYNLQRFYLFKNTSSAGNMSFAQPIFYRDTALNFASQAYVADLNNDGKAELVMPNFRDKRIVLAQNKMLSNFYSKDTGEFKKLGTWGVNGDGSGQTPPDFGPNNIFHLANRNDYRLPLPPTDPYPPCGMGDWTVANLDIPGGVELHFQPSCYGDTLRVWDLPGAGTLSGEWNSNLALVGTYGRDVSVKFSGNSNPIGSLRVQRTVGSNTIITTPVQIGERLILNSGNVNASGNITLKSSALVPPVSTNAKMTGLLTSERIIPAGRHWKFLCSPLESSTSINANWQEGVTTSSPNPNPNPGYGIQIAGGSTIDGFDAGDFSSIKRYNNATDTWVPLANTNVTRVSAEPYMVYNGGDRSIYTNNTTSPAKNTILRVRGTLRTGDQTYPVAAAGYTAVPNPYPMHIDFSKITKNNVQSNNFWIWNSRSAGSNGMGQWINVSWDGYKWDANPPATGSYSQGIAPGEAFMVSSTGSAGSVVIKESDKIDYSSSYLRQQPNVLPTLRIALYTAENKDNDYLLDQTCISYNSRYSDKLDDYDVEKLNNFKENVAMVRNNKNLIVERKSAISNSDTIQLKLWNTERKSYQLYINAENLSSSTVKSATLEDAYLHTSIPIDINSITQQTFAVTLDPASQNPYRFKIILNGKTSSPAISAAQGSREVRVYPNPIISKTINLEFNNKPKGNYKVELIDSKGAKVLTKTIYNEGGLFSKEISSPTVVSKGIYRLKVSKGNDSNVINLSFN